MKMNLKAWYRRQGSLVKLRANISRAKYSILTIISPELNTRVRYREVFKKKLNLDNPKTLNEKILWLKHKKYMHDPLVIQCVDKYRVREYIKECGCGEILNELYGVYDDPSSIPWDSLPDKFVLKWNFGAGMNIVCSDKNSLDYKRVISQLKKWGRVRYWLPHSEMQYKYTPKKIICEKFLQDDQSPDVVPDYKVYCFHGNPETIFVMHDRGHDIKSEFFDMEWNLLENTNKYSSPDHITQKPKCLKQMIEVSKRLSKPFPFVRCDYYIVNDKLYFGELTFTPAGGFYVSQTNIHGKEMTDYLEVPLKE